VRSGKSPAFPLGHWLPLVACRDHVTVEMPEHLRRPRISPPTSTFHSDMPPARRRGVVGYDSGGHSQSRVGDREASGARRLCSRGQGRHSSLSLSWTWSLTAGLVVAEGPQSPDCNVSTVYNGLW